MWCEYRCELDDRKVYSKQNGIVLSMVETFIQNKMESW